MGAFTPAAHAPVAERVRLEDFEQVDDYLRAYLADERFRSAHSSAFERWSDAAAVLHGASFKDGLLLAGRRASQAMDEFVGSFPAAEASNTYDGMAAVIEGCRAQVGDARCELLWDLFSYWLLLNHTVQREREGREGGSQLGWEDTRRVVVLTALVMVEIDRSV